MPDLLGAMTHRSPNGIVHRIRLSGEARYFRVACLPADVDFAWADITAWRPGALSAPVTCLECLAQ